MILEFSLTLPDGKKYFIYILVLLVVEWLQRDKQHGLSKLPNNKYIRFSIYIVLSLIILFFRGGQSNFIYFQF